MLQDARHSLELYSLIYYTAVTVFPGWMQGSESLSSIPAPKFVQQHEFVPSTQPISEQSEAVPRNSKSWRCAWWLDPTVEYGCKYKAWPWHLAWRSFEKVSVLLVFNHMPAASAFPENLCCHISASLCEMFLYFGGGKYPALLAHPGELPRCCFQLNIHCPIYSSWSFLC